MNKLPVVETVSPQEQLPQHSSHGGIEWSRKKWLSKYSFTEILKIEIFNIYEYSL